MSRLRTLQVEIIMNCYKFVHLSAGIQEFSGDGVLREKCAAICSLETTEFQTLETSWGFYNQKSMWFSGHLIPGPTSQFQSSLPYSFSFFLFFFWFPEINLFVLHFFSISFDQIQKMKYQVVGKE